MATIKRVIFDLDNTLINWKSEYLEGIKKAAKEYDLIDHYQEIDNLDSTYENKYKRYTIENWQSHIKNNLGLEVSKEFIQTWLDNLGTMSEENPEVNEVLEYLSSKYELVVLTNWFQDCQKKRLEHARMCHYFKEIIGGDNAIKPSLESYKLAIGSHLPEECIMIGDNLEQDVKGAINAGLQAIYLTTTENEYEFPTIKNLKELKKLL